MFETPVVCHGLILVGHTGSGNTKVDNLIGLLSREKMLST